MYLPVGPGVLGTTTTVTADMAEMTEGLQSAGDVVAAGFTVLAGHMDAMHGDIGTFKRDVGTLKGDV